MSSIAQLRGRTALNARQDASRLCYWLLVSPTGAWPGPDATVFMPVLSKTKVLTSASLPCAENSLPFNRKLTPAALPTLTMISRLARVEVWAGAIRVSWVTCCPSAMTETQEFSAARITSLRPGSGSGVVAEWRGFGFRIVTSLATPGSDSELDARDTGGAGAGC